MFGKKETKETRFEILLEEQVRPLHLVKIYRDKQTGVQYMLATVGNGGGLTPLLDKDGKPVIDRDTNS
ncbi:MAG: DUF6440 family protein [Oscillospiraceae bacterium]|nr:DUF6440 family protein [Oscillospiraceae bacterium]